MFVYSLTCLSPNLKDVRHLEDIEVIYLNGNSLDVDILVKIGEGNIKIALSEEGKENLQRAREVVNKVVQEHRSEWLLGYQTVRCLHAR